MTRYNPEYRKTILLYKLWNFLRGEVWDMSAGAYEYGRYESGNGTIYRIRIQPETLGLTIGGVANTASTNAITGQGTVRVSAGKRSFGVVPRTVTIGFTGTPPTGYQVNGRIRLPYLQADGWEDINNDDTGTYLGAAIKVFGKSPEYVR